MSAIEYYNHDNYPSSGSPGSAQAMRNELEAIESGFGKLPDLVGNGSKLVRVKADGTGLEAYTDFTLPGSPSLFYNGAGGWGSLNVSAISRITRTSNIELNSGNNANYIVITTGGFTQTFSASLPSSWFAFIENRSTAAITIPASDGLTNWKMYPGEARLFMRDATALFSSVIKRFNYVATASESFIWPPGYAELEIDLVGGGGGGGSGRRGAASTTRYGGAPGGTPARIPARRVRGTPGAAIALTIGAAGVGGAAVTVDTTSGEPGTAGGNTAFGTYATAYGGVGGVGGSAASQRTSGSGSMGPGASGTTTKGGLPSGAAMGDQVDGYQNNIGEGGGAAVASLPGGCTVYGGAGSNSNSTTVATITDGGSSMYGVPGATCGALITSTNTMATKAGDAGARGSYTPGGGPVGGTCGGTPTAGADGAAAASTDDVGESGAGGGSSITVDAAAGGNGGFPGGAGGGGGASLNGFNSGKGGDGAAGRAVIKGVA